LLRFQAENRLKVSLAPALRLFPQSLTAFRESLFPHICPRVAPQIELYHILSKLVKRFLASRESRAFSYRFLALRFISARSFSSLFAFKSVDA
jgi:hypothetical protein